MDSESLAFVEALYLDYLNDPSSVDEPWRRYFDDLPGRNGKPEPRREGPSFRTRSIFNPAGSGGSDQSADEAAALQERVDRLIRVYRVRGHRIARIDPLDRTIPYMPELEPSSFGLTEADMDKTIRASSIDYPGLNTPRKVLEHLTETYCRSIAVQFMHIDDLDVTSWIGKRVERSKNRIDISHEQQIRIFKRLCDAAAFEQYLQTKYIGSKSFSLEGGESLIPLMDMAIEKAGDQGIRQIVIGMAHRGRLNVLANIMGKTPRQIFSEFEDYDDNGDTIGDVKYHLGFSNDWTTRSGRSVHLSLCFNPSHLEFVNPIALGRTRAKQDRFGDTDRKEATALIIHGDAAIAGEGVSQETFNLSQLGGYHIGGAIHVVLNNQIGFTTLPSDARSSTYATDVAKMLQIPIFHVNGEDPEAVAQVIELAMEFRHKFRRDVVIDLYCYRLRGHNEGDEPSFTQPNMYRAIRSHPSVVDAYMERLVAQGGITREEAEIIKANPKKEFDEELAAVKRRTQIISNEKRSALWKDYFGGPESDADHPATHVPEERLKELLRTVTTLPDDFTAHRTIKKRFLDVRREMIDDEKPLDWGAGEALAFATLATEGHPVRLTGQDAERGTFSHRHANLHDFKTGALYPVFQHLAPDQAVVEIYNSPLSEIGVLGYEYGYSLDCPNGLVAWEAQFGDFVNVAQVIIDQFIASAETKWSRLSGLVLLLPHGMEGMGPEHSSARLERFLNLTARDNMQVVNLTTPAQIFHLLRLQTKRKWKKPLIVMTPKSLLRHPLAVSQWSDFSEGNFQRFIADDREVAKPSRIVLCTGKIYYDLIEARRDLEAKDIAIVRLEQLYPLKQADIEAMLAPYPKGTPVYWVQEEPLNMGAAMHIDWHFRHDFSDVPDIKMIAREISSSPATGSARVHKEQQKALIERALGIKE